MSNSNNILTLSTCFYIFKCKFDVDTYLKWADNMLSNVNNYNLVIYSDNNSSKYLKKYLYNKNIKLIIKECEKFYNYKYAKDWVKNHIKNDLYNNRIEWKVNMLWSEKIHFVNETMINEYFITDFYGWCDIGYFRFDDKEICKEFFETWPSNSKLMSLDKSKIYYACVDTDERRLDILIDIIKDKNSQGLPKKPIPPVQHSISGGFFISHKQNIDWWKNTYDNKLQLYFSNDYLVKDDQIIIADCVFTEIDKFGIIFENSNLDIWFSFQRFLLQ